MLTSYGYHDSGGGTIVPRHVAQELARRGWDVTVFHAAVGRTEDAEPYAVRTWDDAGVGLIGVFNRFWFKRTAPDWHLFDWREMTETFPDATIYRERYLGMTKSLMAVKT